MPRANWTDRPFPGAPENETAPLLDRDAVLVRAPARGAARFTYVRPPAGDSRWLGESYQLFDGSYLGTRDHVRAYVAPGANWTAMQAHAEYWDRFRLRHTVTSTERPQERLDGQFRDDARVREISQTHLRNDDAADSDGWATVLRLATLAGAVALVGQSDRDAIPSLGREPKRAVAISGAVLGLYMLVRLGGIGLENLAADLSPKWIAGGLYPVIAVGLPIAAYHLGRHLPPIVAAEGTIAGFGSALVLEYGLLGLSGVSLGLVLHRLAMVLALGLVAAGGAAVTRSDRRTVLAVGVSAWVLGLGFPLVGFV